MATSEIGPTKCGQCIAFYIGHLFFDSEKNIHFDIHEPENSMIYLLPNTLTMTLGVFRFMEQTLKKDGGLQCRGEGRE